MNNHQSQNDTEDNTKTFENSLVLSHEEKLIENRLFSKLDWKNEFEQDLAFKDCTICDSDFSNSNLDGLRLENCRILNCDFSGASIKNGDFEESIFYDRSSQKGCAFQTVSMAIRFDPFSDNKIDPPQSGVIYFPAFCFNR